MFCDIACIILHGPTNIVIEYLEGELKKDVESCVRSFVSWQGLEVTDYALKFYPDINFFLMGSKRYIVYFLKNSEGGNISDTFAVTDKKTNTTNLIDISYSNNGKMKFTTTPANCNFFKSNYYLTVANWIKGYFRKSEGFFVPPTPTNIEKFKVGR